MRILKADPTPGGRQLRSIIENFEEAERWSPERLARYQAEQLGRLLAHAYETVPFHRARLAAAGYRPGMAISPEFWRSLPALERRDLQDQGDALKSTRLPAEYGKTFKISTSGSTAMPVSVWRSDLQALILEAVVLRKVLWQGCDFAAKLGVVMRDPEKLSGPPAGRHYPDWGSPAALMFATGPSVVLDNGASIAEIVAWLAREAPAYLRIAPTLLKEVSFHLLDRGMGPPTLRGIMSSAEVVAPGLRALVRRVFGVDVFASYGANEAGTIALQCPAHEHYHVQAEATLVEVIDDEGKPCAPGQVGTVLLTALHSFAYPLIRYAIGDRAEVGGPCSCGRPHPVLRQIIGRTRDQIVLPSGQRRYVHFGQVLAFWDFGDIRQFQVVQKTHQDLELRLVTRRPLSAEIEAELARRLRGMTGEHFRVAITYHDAIPLTAGGKFIDLICEVADEAPGRLAG